MDHGPQRDPDHAVDDRDQQEQSRPVVRRPQPAQPEDDATLVLGQDTDRAHHDDEHDEHGDENPYDRRRQHGPSLRDDLGRVTPSTSPSRSRTLRSCALRWYVE